MNPVLTLHPESQSNAPPNQVARHCFLTAVTRPRRARRRAGAPKAPEENNHLLPQGYRPMR